MKMVIRHGLLSRRTLNLGSGALFCALALAAGPALAQHYNVIGQPGPSVTVDTSVLDELGPPNSIGTANAAPNRFGPGVAVRSAPAPATGAAKVPPSRLVAVPSLPGRPAPQVGQNRVVNAAATGRDAMPASPPPAPPPAPQTRAPAPPAPVAPPAPPAPPPRQAAAPAPAVTPPPPPPPPAPAVASAPPAPTTPTPPAPPAPPAAPPPPPAAAAPAAPPPPAPAAAPAPPPAPQVAALPPAASAPGASGPGRLSFEGGSAALSEAARQELDRLAATMKGNEAQRLQVVAYASSQGGNTSAARRLSLSRALAVRTYLIDKDIRSTRIDVRAMGAPEGANSGPADRVDLVLVSQ